MRKAQSDEDYKVLIPEFPPANRLDEQHLIAQFFTFKIRVSTVGALLGHGGAGVAGLSFAPLHRLPVISPGRRPFLRPASPI